MPIASRYCDISARPRLDGVISLFKNKYTIYSRAHTHVYEVNATARRIYGMWAALRNRDANQVSLGTARDQFPGRCFKTTSMDDSRAKFHYQIRILVIRCTGTSLPPSLPPPTSSVRVFARTREIFSRVQHATKSRLADGGRGGGGEAGDRLDSYVRLKHFSVIPIWG